MLRQGLAQNRCDSDLDAGVAVIVALHVPLEAQRESASVARRTDEENRAGQRDASISQDRAPQRRRIHAAHPFRHAASATGSA